MRQKKRVRLKMEILFDQLDILYPTFGITRNEHNIKVILFPEEFLKSGVTFFPVEEFLNFDIDQLLYKIEKHLNTLQGNCYCCGGCPDCTCQPCMHFIARYHFNSFLDSELKRAILGNKKKTQ